MKYEYRSSWFLKLLCKMVKKQGAFNVPIVEQEKQNPVPFKRHGLQKHKVCNLDVYTIQSHTNDVFVYLHGGAYLLGIDDYNVDFMRILQKKSKATVHMIDYPLAPLYKVEHVVNEVYHTIKELITDKKEYNHHLIGDSAGGGMSLAILKRLKHDCIPVKNTFLLSPWLDVSMSNKEIDKYKDLDIVLQKDDLIECGNLYTNNNPSHLDASPLNDDFTGFNNITIFTGTHDMLYPDILKFYDKNPASTIYIYKEAPHGFMLFPYTKERKKTVTTIKRIIKNI